MKRKSRIYFVILASILLSFTVSTSQVYANNTELQIAPDVQQSIDLLNCSPIGNRYAYLSKQEVQNAIEKGGSAATEAFFHATGKTKAVQLPILTENDLISNEIINDDSFISYDPDTGITRVIPWIGPVERKQVTVLPQVNVLQTIAPRSYPNDWVVSDPQNYQEHRSTCRLLIYTKNNVYHATGFMISDNDVLTAAHVVYDLQEYGGYASSVAVVPAVSDSHPGGTYGLYAGKVTYYLQNGFIQGDKSKDLAIISLDGSSKPFACGYYSLLNPGNTKGWWVRSQGYPYDYHTLQCFGGNVISDGGNMIGVTGSALPGMSGGPVMDASKKVIGVISGAYQGSSGYNAVRFDTTTYNMILSFR